MSGNISKSRKWLLTQRRMTRITWQNTHTSNRYFQGEPRLSGCPHVCVWPGGVTVRVPVQLPAILLSGNNLRQVVHTHVPLSSSSINRYQWKGDDALRLWMSPQVWLHTGHVSDFSGLSIYELNGLREGDEHPAYTPLKYGALYPTSHLPHHPPSMHCPSTYQTPYPNKIQNPTTYNLHHPDTLHNQPSKASFPIAKQFQSPILFSFKTNHQIMPIPSPSTSRLISMQKI